MNIMESRPLKRARLSTTRLCHTDPRLVEPWAERCVKPVVTWLCPCGLSLAADTSWPRPVTSSQAPLCQQRWCHNTERRESIRHGDAQQGKKRLARARASGRLEFLFSISRYFSFKARDIMRKNPLSPSLGGGGDPAGLQSVRSSRACSHSLPLRSPRSGPFTHHWKNALLWCDCFQPFFCILFKAV